MKVEFLAAAREEFLNAVSYYDSEKQGLDDEFDEMRATRPSSLSRKISQLR